MQTIVLSGYETNVPAWSPIRLGTYDSYGIEQLKIVQNDGWENLSVVAIFHAPNAEEPIKVLVPATGVIDVPPKATSKSSGKGRITFVGYATKVQRISMDVIYILDDHGSIEGKEPEEPTESLLEQVLTASNNAQQAAIAAKDSAEKAASDVAPYAERAEEAANDAKEYCADAKKSAELAQQAVSNTGYMAMHVDPDSGHLIYTRTTNLKDKISFSIINDTNLEVTIHE